MTAGRPVYLVAVTVDDVGSELNRLLRNLSPKHPLRAPVSRTGRTRDDFLDGSVNSVTCTRLRLGVSFFTPAREERQ
jgi:hypothetical protein